MQGRWQPSGESGCGIRFKGKRGRVGLKDRAGVDLHGAGHAERGPAAEARPRSDLVKPRSLRQDVWGPKARRIASGMAVGAIVRRSRMATRVLACSSSAPSTRRMIR